MHSWQLVNYTRNNTSLATKINDLENFISNYTNAIVAYSGGIDSSLVASIATNVLGKSNSLIVIAVSPSLNRKEYERALDLAKKNDWNFKSIYTNEFSNNNYLKNDFSRCFYCKFELYEKLEEILKNEKYNVIFNGTNIDDLSDFRPGNDAAKKKNIVSPLVKCKINKNEIRQIAKQIGLPNWDKPAQPCLSSRVPHGVKISMDILKKIEDSENFLNELGFINFRVRIHGDLAKIEASENDFEKFSDPEIRKKIVKNFKKYGFKYVSLDLMFFKSGNLSRAHERK